MKLLACLFTLWILPILAFAQAKVMNPGKAYGQLVFLSSEDVLNQSPKYKALNPLSIPVFAELPMELSVVAGTITLKQQNLLSHVQIKARARRTPNLDISGLDGGMSHPSMQNLKDGMWIYMQLTADGEITLEPSTQEEALTFSKRKKDNTIRLQYDLKSYGILDSQDLGWQDFKRVGSKAANYAELAKALNTSEREVVRPALALPFYFYGKFLQDNPKIKEHIQRLLRDPLMNQTLRVEYRDKKLQELRDLMQSEEAVVDQYLVKYLVEIFERIRDSKGQPHSMKLRSSTNSEDLPDFNGAGLYQSKSYKPVKKGVEKTLQEKYEELRQALRTVWSSVWTLRAFDERVYFQIPHQDVKMGVQINPSFSDELVDGVVVTRNISEDPRYTGAGVYIEAQRGDKHSVANPQPGVRPEKILVLYDSKNPLTVSSYDIKILQKSNIADDGESVLNQDNPQNVMTDAEIKDLAYQALKATKHFKPLLGKNNSKFALDLEFKVDKSDTGHRQVYIKQSRPLVD